MHRFLVLLITALMLSFGVSALALNPAPTYPDRYWKQDVSLGSTKIFPSRYRTMLDAFPENAAEPLPTREGMDTLCISGSAQYNVEQFEAMIADIRSKTEAEIFVFDLRQETHGFVNGEAVSLYANKNRGNVGHGTQEVLKIERKQLGELLNTELTFEQHGHGGAKKPGEKKENQDKKDSGKSMTQTVTLQVTDIMTEAQVCDSQDVQYVRVACTDLMRPDDEQIDEFLTVYKTLPEGTWLHFHCAAGVGRTGIFMMLADMIRNPDVPLEDIISRQVLLGAQDPRGSLLEEDVWKVSLLNHFHDYVGECGPDYQTSFSDWALAQTWE